jgi:hypothetical protein
MLFIFCRHSDNFTEDGDIINPFNVSDFSVTDDDNIFLIQAIVTLENNDLLPVDVRDQLFAISNDRFNVTGNGTSQLVIDAVGGRRLITIQPEFVDFLKTVQFITNDQAPDIVRNLSLVVQEFPLGEAPSSPAYVPIQVIPVNDRPVLQSSQVSGIPLDDYLSTNPGFAPSFLLSDSDVFDIDRRSSISSDFIGLAIVSTSQPESLGVWQYWSDKEMQWMEFPVDLSNCFPLFVRPNERVRFVPQPNPAKEDGVATFDYRAWDGSSEIVDCDVNDTLLLTTGKS